MKLFIASILVAIVAASLSSDELRDTPKSPVDLSPYKAGNEYRYRFDSQIASGIAEISNQRALTRIQADAILYFNSDRSVTLRLDNIRVGSSPARTIDHIDRIHSFSLVDQKEIEPDHSRKLVLPLQFNYVDGLIEKILFDSEDDVWSKNIKRSVLNMLQVNLKARNLPDEQKKEVKVQDPSWKSLTPRMFTAPETTIEGECETTYVINKLENMRQNDLDFFNVTKTVDFTNCKKLADVSYGPQVERRLIDQWQEKQWDDEEEQKLRRSTILRHFVVGTPEKFAIQKVESVSQYSFKAFNAEQETPMVTVVLQELTSIGVNTNPSEQQASPRDSNQESLLYSNDYDRDVKHFYMYGDDEFTQETSPFSKITNKQQLITNLLVKIHKTTQNKQTGIDSEDAVLLTRLVELLRTCSVAEIEDIISRTEGKPLGLLYDALILAATRNTIHVLTDKIINKKITVPKAIQSLKALSGSPAPSDKQIEILTRLCKSEPAKRSEGLRQSCWLTVGTLIGELCKTSQQNSYVINKKATNELCPRHITDKFVETFESEYRSARNRYEKILILKAIGNAGLEESLPKLKQTIYTPDEDPMVRVQAVDSLRRLVNELPTEVQRILLPVFKNQQELTEVRLNALSLIMQTNPDNGVLDQIASVLLRERSKNVRSFVYDIVQAYAKSPIAKEQKLAQHLKAIIKLAGIDENEAENLGFSRAHHIPIYSRTQDEGIFFNWESIFASGNALPKKISAGIDSFLNGVFEKNAFEVSLQQEDLERWFKKFSDNWYSDSDRSTSTSRQGNDELSRIFSNLELKARREGETRGRQYTSPFGLFSLRFRNIDYAILPLDQETMPENLRKLINGEKLYVSDLSFLSYLNGEVHETTAIWNFAWSLTKIPTTAGVPLKLTLSIPALASIEFSGKLRANGMLIKVQPSISVSHVQKIEAWLPLVTSGVENIVSLEYNYPLEYETLIDRAEKSLKYSYKIPENDVRVLGFHSLPVTFVREYDSNTHVHKEARVKAIQNERLEQYARQLDFVYESVVGLPFHATGHVHVPATMSYADIFNAFMTTENHVHYEFKPSDSTPKQIQLKLSGDVFSQNDGRLRPIFNNFYDKFDDQLKKIYDFQNLDTADDQSLSKVLRKYESQKSYKHSLQAEVLTIGGDQQQKSSKFEIETTCDEQFGFCKTKVNVRRHPLLDGENREWKFEASVQTIVPEFSVDYQQYEERKSEKNHKFLGSVDCSWGTNEQQYVNLRIHGEQAKTREWIDLEKIESKRKNVDVRERSAFLNKYDVSAEYKLEPEVKNYFARVFGYWKLKNFFNTKVESTYGFGSGKKSTGLVTALVVIDPITRQFFNVSVNSPFEKVHINTIPLSSKITPFPLVRRQSSTKAIKSAQNLISSIATNQECTVDGSQVRTFDEVTFKAPITKCYTVLAKDCNRDSRFAVLVKKTDNENKKLKVIHKNGNIVEIEKDQDGSENDPNFRVTVNGDPIQTQDWENYDVSKLDNVITIENRDITVRFNGRQVWVRASQFHKNNLCGICGHYDDDKENEFVNAKNEKTSDIRQYFGSFTLKDENCESDYEEITRNQQFETVDSDDEFGQRSNQDGEEGEPIEKTLVMEYNHKVCFSMKPARECPRNQYPSNQSINVKIQFACLARDSVQARRLLRQLKTDNVLEEVRTLAPSFVETVKTPTKCVEF